MTPIRSAIFLACVGVAVLQPPSALALVDSKTISPTRCAPLGPATTLSDLNITAYGVFNPGDTNESVICELPVDGDTDWALPPNVSAKIEVHYRAGAVAGRVSCTAYTGTTVVGTFPTYALSYAPPFQVAGTRQYFFIDLADANGGGVAGSPPSNVVCVISPKAALGTIFFYEYVRTTSLNVGS